jgi:hypothetical protein
MVLTECVCPGSTTRRLDRWSSDTMQVGVDGGDV